MVKRIFLHVGLPKTGTTSLQVSLRDEAGLHYVHEPGAPEGQSRAVTKALRPGMGAEGAAWLADLSAAISADPRDVVISDEALSKVGEVSAERLVDFLSGLPGRVHCFLVLRPFLSWLESLINQAAKNGNFDFTRFDATSATDINGYPLDFERVRAFYADVANRVGDRMVLRVVRYSPDINDRLRKAMDLEPEPASGPPRNSSLRPGAAFTLACRAAGITPPDAAAETGLRFIGRAEADALHDLYGSGLARLTGALGWDPRVLDDHARVMRAAEARSYLAIGRGLFSAA